MSNENQTTRVSELDTASCSAWGSSPWSPIREMVCLAVLDCRHIQANISEIKLLKYHHGRHYARRLRSAEQKLSQRKEIVKRLFETRHYLQNINVEDANEK